MASRRPARGHTAERDARTGARRRTASPPAQRRSEVRLRPLTTTLHAVQPVESGFRQRFPRGVSPQGSSARSRWRGIASCRHIARAVPVGISRCRGPDVRRSDRAQRARGDGAPSHADPAGRRLAPSSAVRGPAEGPPAGSRGARNPPDLREVEDEVLQPTGRRQWFLRARQVAILAGRCEHTRAIACRL